MKPRIFLADDHELFREGLKSLIEKKSGYDVIGEANSGIGLAENLAKINIDILILDFSMPGKSGLELIEELKIFVPDIKILILTMHPEERFAIRCLKTGADGYLTKNSAAKELIRAIDKILNGHKYVSEELGEKLAFELNKPLNKPHEQLSDREYQVFFLLAQGRSNQQITEELNISPSTVNTYRNRIKDKMSLNNIAEMIRYALDNNLLE
jgi:DNA-binding NarL/FixJ family response regulator